MKKAILSLGLLVLCSGVVLAQGKKDKKDKKDDKDDKIVKDIKNNKVINSHTELSSKLENFINSNYDVYD